MAGYIGLSQSFLIGKAIWISSMIKNKD